MARKTGRPRWVPLDLEEVRKLAASGLTMDQIADALGISRTTLFKKKREFADFADAIKKGAAEGIIVASSKLFQMVKGGNLGAVIFYLKSRAGWREHSDGANANIKLNISGRGERMEEEIEAERQEQMKMIRLLTVEERRIYLDLMKRAAERLKRAKGPLIEIRAGTALDDAADGRNGDG